MSKYRIRLENGRVIGPFDKRELFDLKTKGHISGKEEAQDFPMGNWMPMDTFEFYEELMDDNKTIVENKNGEDKTFVIDLTKLHLLKKEKEIEEIEVKETEPPKIELTETIRLSNTEIKQELVQATSIEEKPVDEILDEKEDKTLINPIAQQEIEMLRRKEQERLLLEAKKLEEEKKSREIEEARIKKIQEEASSDAATQMINLNQLVLMEKAEENEVQIEQERKEYIKKKKKEDKETEDEEDEEVASPDKKKKIIMVLAILALAYAFLMPEEKPKTPEFKHIQPAIVFPIPYDAADEQKSKAAYQRGVEFLNEGTYLSLIEAGRKFKESYENDMENLQALNLMVRTYGELLKYSEDKLIDAQTLFNIIQSKRSFLLQDPNGVVGLNLFYMAINKEDAAIDVVQKYLKLRPKDVIQDLFAVYLNSLLKKGNLDIAKQIYTALENAPDKNNSSYMAMIDYNIIDQKFDKAMELASEGIKKFPQDNNLILKKAELLVKEGKAKEAIPLVKKVEERDYGNNNKTLAKFFEIKGMIYAFEKQPEEATKFFLRSLKVENSDALRMNLALLSSSDDESATSKLINESKAIKLLNQAKEFFNNRNYKLAMSYAAKATDAYPGHIPSELFLAKVQLKLGQANQSIKTLSDLVAKYPEDKDINLALVEAYIETYKFNEAKNRIQIISSSDYRDSAEFASMNARLFQKMGDSLQALSWYQQAIQINPINDQDIFALAEILMKKNNFKAARTYLNKCMELDPINPDYRIAYARLIYETQDDMAAIGYLLSLQEEFKDNPKIMSEMAIFYYRAGKVKDFLTLKEKLEKEHTMDSSLYDFLIKAALLDEKYSEVPLLVEKLIDLEPGNLEQMMTAGRVLFENGKLVEAAKWFKRIEEKLPGYPRVLYYLAKIDYLAGDTDLALKKVEQNIKENGENDTDLVLMAQIKQTKGDMIDAENLYKKAQKLNPRSFDALMGLADISTMRNNHDLALDLYKRASKIKAEEAIVHKKIGDVYRQLGQGTLAIEAYKIYLEMDPESPYKNNLESYINLMK